jgi:hypothetical protein
MSEVQAVEVQEAVETQIVEQVEVTEAPKLHKFSSEFLVPEAVAKDLMNLNNSIEQLKERLVSTLRTVGAALQVPVGYVPVNNYTMFVPLTEVQELINRANAAQNAARQDEEAALEALEDEPVAESV